MAFSRMPLRNCFCFLPNIIKLFFVPLSPGLVWQIFLWDRYGAGTLNNFTCSNNVADDSGGCMYAAGTAIINGTVMKGNEAELGGAICELRRCA